MDEQGLPQGFEAPAGDDTGPAAGMISQYVKDLSFENPNAPAIYQAQTAPGIDVQFNISAAQVGEEVHELTLKIEVRAESEGKTAFIEGSLRLDNWEDRQRGEKRSKLYVVADDWQFVGSGPGGGASGSGGGRVEQEGVPAGSEPEFLDEDTPF